MPSEYQYEVKQKIFIPADPFIGGCGTAVIECTRGATSGDHINMKEHVKNRRKDVVQLPRTVSSPAEIVKGLINKDPRAAADLYERYGAKINSKVWRLLGADSEHDDVVHQVFIHVLAGIGKLKKPDSLEDWIYGVTVNTVRREIRRRKYRRILVPMAEPPEITRKDSGPDGKMFANQFYEVLRTLKPDDHIVFVLRFVEGRSLGEVAAIGGYSLSTAKRRLARAKKEFAKRAAKNPVLASVIEEIKNAR